MTRLGLTENKVAKLAAQIYAVGIIGFTLPLTHNIFIRLMPVVIVMSLFVTLAFHNEKWNSKSVTLFSIIVLFAWLIEVAGVATGKIFGSYNYGIALGPKMLGTPFLIGFNWLILIYGTASVVSVTSLHPVVKVILASLFMVTYDFFLEIVAPGLKMWEFENGTAPFKNYLAWFIIALAFHSALKISGIKASNHVASVVFLVQLFFFIILSVIQIIK